MRQAARRGAAGRDAGAPFPGLPAAPCAPALPCLLAAARGLLAALGVVAALGVLAALTGSARAGPKPFYEFQVVAREGADGVVDLLSSGSINRHGSVAFTAVMTDDSVGYASALYTRL